MNRIVPALAAAGVLIVTAGANAWADGDPVKGKRVFNKCKTCHELTTAKNKIGPTLQGVIGRKAGTVPGFKYSSAMKESGIVWDEKTIQEYIADPKKMVPGNRMVLAPIKKEDQREDVIAFIKEQQKK
jgi:cytochrome c